MNFENLIGKLAEKGIQASEVYVEKNGIPYTGLCVSADENSRIRPVLYLDDNITEEEVIARAMELVQHPQISVGDILDCVTSKSFILEHANLAIMRKAPEDAVMLPYLGQELCFKLHLDGFPDVGGSGSITITKPLLEKAGLSFEELMQKAASNTNSRLAVNTVASALGFEGDDSPIGPDFYMFSTRDNIDGAAALAFKSLFRTLCEEHGYTEGMVLFPSSTEEVLGIPFQEEDFDPAGALRMVEEINESVVDEKIRLNPAVYRYELETDTIQVIAGGGEAYGCVQ